MVYGKVSTCLLCFTERSSIWREHHLTMFGPLQYFHYPLLQSTSPPYNEPYENLSLSLNPIAIIVWSIDLWGCLLKWWWLEDTFPLASTWLCTLTPSHQYKTKKKRPVIDRLIDRRWSACSSTHLPGAFHFSGTSLIDSIDIDSYGVDRWGSCGCRDTSTSGCDGPTAWRTTCSLWTSKRRRLISIFIVSSIII